MNATMSALCTARVTTGYVLATGQRWGLPAPSWEERFQPGELRRRRICTYLQYTLQETCTYALGHLSL
jgi:hypothetical protein